jgi:hypothetical protein
MFDNAPASSSYALLGLWNNGSVSASELGVTQQVYEDYASGSDYTTYSVPSTKYRIMLAVGALNVSEAKAIATNLLNAGQGNAIIRPMWEQNQGSWFAGWNEKTFTASQYIAEWITIYNAMKSVAPNLQFIWNPNAGEGNNISGRTTQDTWPGAQYVNYVGVDVYDYGGYETNVQQILDFASGHPESGWPQLSTPLPAAFPEWGLNGSDDTSFMNYMTTVINNSTDNVGLQSYFSCGPSQGCTSPNSDISEFPNSLAIYKTAFKNE